MRLESGGRDERVPVLWHLKVSNYNEKARWALDHKRVPHVRRAVDPGRHQAIARKLTGGQTFRCSCWTARRSATRRESSRHSSDAIPTRRSTRRSPSSAGGHWSSRTSSTRSSGPTRAYWWSTTCCRTPTSRWGPSSPTSEARATSPPGRPSQRCGAGWQRRRRGRAPRRARFREARTAGERFRAELPPSGYLVGDQFTVADLTLASLVAPAVAPEQFPYPQPQRGHPLLAPLRDVLAEPGLLDWTCEMYARHRGPSAELGRRMTTVRHRLSR